MSEDTIDLKKVVKSLKERISVLEEELQKERDENKILNSSINILKCKWLSK